MSTTEQPAPPTLQKLYHGKLRQMVEEALTIRFLLKQPIFNDGINVTLQRVYNRYLDTVKALRAERYSWVFTVSDIEELRIENGPNQFTLPMVDLKGYLPIASNSDIPELLRKHGVETVHQTHEGSWCPVFPTKKDATQAIKVIDRLIDETILYPPQKDA